MGRGLGILKRNTGRGVRKKFQFPDSFYYTTQVVNTKTSAKLIGDAIEYEKKRLYDDYSLGDWQSDLIELALTMVDKSSDPLDLEILEQATVSGVSSKRKVLTVPLDNRARAGQIVKDAPKLVEGLNNQPLRREISMHTRDDGTILLRVEERQASYGKASPVSKSDFQFTHQVIMEKILDPDLTTAASAEALAQAHQLVADYEQERRGNKEMRSEEEARKQKVADAQRLQKVLETTLSEMRARDLSVD